MRFGTRLVQFPKAFLVSLALLGALSLLAGFVLAGCGGGGQTATRTLQAANDCPTCTNDPGTPGPPDTQFTNVKSVAMRADPAGGMPHFFDSENREIPKEGVAELFRQLPKDGKSALTFKLLDPPTAPSDTGGRGVDVKFNVGCYFIRIAWEKHYVGGCIKRDAWHLGLLVRNTCSNTMTFDGHACVWWQSGPQFGLYNSANGWCAQSRGTFTEIRGKIADGLIAAGIGSWLANAIADVSASVVGGAFAL